MTGLGSWVEAHTEVCRGGRVYRVLVNHRTGQAIELSDAEAEICDQLGTRPVTGAFAAELREQGFLAGEPPPPRRRAVEFSGARLEVRWAGAGRGGRRVFPRRPAPVPPGGRGHADPAGPGRPGRRHRRPHLGPALRRACPSGADPRRDRPEPGCGRRARVRPRPGRRPASARRRRRRDPAAPGHPGLLRRVGRRGAADAPSAARPGRRWGMGRVAVHLAGRDLAVAGAAAFGAAAAAQVRDPQRGHHRHQPAPVHRPGRVVAARRRPGRPRPEPPRPRRRHPADHRRRRRAAPYDRGPGSGRLRRRQRPGRRRLAAYRRVLLVPAVRRPGRRPRPPWSGRLDRAGRRSRGPGPAAATATAVRLPAAVRGLRDLYGAIVFRWQWRWRIPATARLPPSPPPPPPRVGRQLQNRRPDHPHPRPRRGPASAPGRR